MSIIDTNIAINLVNNDEGIKDDITLVTLAEFPPIKSYSRFEGRIIYPNLDDLNLVVSLQEKLRAKGLMQGFADLLIAAICINRNEELHTADQGFNEIAKVSDLKIRKR